MSINLSICGADCSGCGFLDNGCTGCRPAEGKIFWTVEPFGGQCPIYDCSVNLKKLNSCGDCIDLPCNLFTDLRDPNISDEEHIESIKKRVNNLKNHKGY